MTARRPKPVSLPQLVLEDYAHLWAPKTDSAVQRAQIELAELSDSDREYHRERVMYALLHQGVRTERALVALLHAFQDEAADGERPPAPPPAAPPNTRPRPTLVRSPPPSQTDVDDASDDDASDGEASDGDGLPDFDAPTEEAPVDDDANDDTAGDEDA